MIATLGPSGPGSPGSPCFPGRPGAPVRPCGKTNTSAITKLIQHCFLLYVFFLFIDMFLLH